MVIHLLQKHDLAKCPLRHITIPWGNINNTKIGDTLVHLYIKFYDWFKLHISMHQVVQHLEIKYSIYVGPSIQN